MELLSHPPNPKIVAVIVARVLSLFGFTGELFTFRSNQPHCGITSHYAPAARQALIV
jgi:hypothetical protein